MKRRPLGYGLVELLVAIALGSLLLLMLHRFLTPILLGSSKNSLQVHLSQQGNLLVTRLERDLKSSHGSALSYSQDERIVALAVCKRAGLGPEGNKLYEQSVNVYIWSAESRQVRLLKRDVSDFPGMVSSVTRPIQLEPDQLRSLVSLMEHGKLLASSVTTFAPLEKWPSEPVNTMVVQLEQAAGGGAQAATYRIEKNVAFR